MGPILAGDYCFDVPHPLYTDVANMGLFQLPRAF
jgi:hypothetical protein